MGAYLWDNSCCLLFGTAANNFLAFALTLDEDAIFVV